MSSMATSTKERGVLEERRMALVDLIDRILVRQTDDPDAYRRIFKHEEWIRNWMVDRPDWRLLKGQGVYRLERLPSLTLPERGLPRLQSAYDYACLCWSLWFAEQRTLQPEDWFTLSELAQEIQRAAQGHFDLGNRQHREALVRALVLLEDLGVLAFNSGETGLWVQGIASEDADAMYEFLPDAPRLLANFDPQALAVLEQAGPRQRTLLGTGQFTHPIARAWRALLLGPALWRADDEEAFEALISNVSRFHQDLERGLGWEMEIRPEYARIVRLAAARQASSLLIDLLPDPQDPQGPRTLRYRYHPILLLAERIRELVNCGELTPVEDGSVAIDEGRLEDLLVELYRMHRRNWGAELGEQLSIREVAQLTFQHMRRIGYLRGPDRMDRCYLLPLSGTIVAHYASVPEPEPRRAENDQGVRQLGLFDVPHGGEPEDVELDGTGA